MENYINNVLLPCSHAYFSFRGSNLNDEIADMHCMFMHNFTSLGMKYLKIPFLYTTSHNTKILVLFVALDI